MLKLNKPELRVMYSQHWLDIKPDVERLGHLRDKALLQLRVGDDSALLELREQWRRVITARTAPSASLAAMSHDVFDHLFPMTLRQRFGLTLVRP